MRIIVQVNNPSDRASMRNVEPHEVDAAPGAFVSVCNDYPAGQRVPRHNHARAQFLHTERGVIAVVTDLGSWVVPPDRAVWIPPGVHHEVSMLAPVRMLSLYVDADIAATLPDACRVVGVSALAGLLMHEALELTPPYEVGSRSERVLWLLLDEIARARELPLNLPFPADARIAARCQAFLAQPAQRETIDDWCRDLAMSRRSFTRRFRDGTGLTFAAWCRQACLLAALPRLAGGESITTIAFDLGYESTSAFATMFRRTMGVAPSRYLATL